MKPNGFGWNVPPKRKLVNMRQSSLVLKGYQMGFVEPSKGKMDHISTCVGNGIVHSEEIYANTHQNHTGRRRWIQWLTLWKPRFAMKGNCRAVAKTTHAVSSIRVIGGTSLYQSEGDVIPPCRLSRVGPEVFRQQSKKIPCRCKICKDLCSSHHFTTINSIPHFQWQLFAHLEAIPKPKSRNSQIAR